MYIVPGIHDIPSSDLDHGADYPDCGSTWLPSVAPDTFKYFKLSHDSFLSYSSQFIIPKQSYPFNAYSGLRNALLNKSRIKKIHRQIK